MKYVKFGIAVIVILFVVLGMLNGVIQTSILPSVAGDSGMETILFLLPFIVTYLLIQYSWNKLVKEAKPSPNDLKINSMLKDVNSSVGSFVKKKVDSTVSIDDEKIYEQVAEELSNGFKKEGLWLKAIEQAAGDESKIKSLYIKFRVESIKKEEVEIKHIKHSEVAEIDEVVENVNKDFDGKTSSGNEAYRKKISQDKKQAYGIVIVIIIAILAFKSIM